MKINRKLHFVIPIETGDGTVHVHAAPIGEEVFDRYFVEVGRTFSAIYEMGLGRAAGPRIALKMLKKISEGLGTWDGAAGVEAGLVAEIHRLCNVAVLGPNGWSTIPFDEAAKRGVIEPENVREVENALVFFTVISCMHTRTALPGILSQAAELYGAQISSLNSTEFANSLPMPTTDVTIGVTVKASSIPS